VILFLSVIACAALCVLRAPQVLSPRGKVSRSSRPCLKHPLSVIHDVSVCKYDDVSAAKVFLPTHCLLSYSSDLEKISYRHPILCTPLRYATQVRQVRGVPPVLPFCTCCVGCFLNITMMHQIQRSFSPMMHQLQRSFSHALSHARARSLSLLFSRGERPLNLSWCCATRFGLGQIVLLCWCCQRRRPK